MAKKRTVEKITDKLVRDLVPPSKANFITYGDDLPGFGIRITATGTRAFVCSYSIDGVDRRKTIGKYPQWSVKAARERFGELRREIDMGRDPLAEDQAKREAPRVQDLYERYVREHLPKKRTRSAADDHSMWIKDILPRLKNVRVADITFDHVDHLHREVTKDRPARANRIIEVFRKALNLAIQWRWITVNPALGVHRNRETPRERYVTPAELPHFMDALEACPQQSSREAITLLVLTGARKTEVLQARWEQFELGNGTWTKPSSETKQDRMHSVPLSSAATELLRTIRNRNQPGRYVFPGAVPGQPLQDVRRSWSAICLNATFSIWKEHPGASALLAKAHGVTGSALVKQVPTLSHHELSPVRH